MYTSDRKLTKKHKFNIFLRILHIVLLDGSDSTCTDTWEHDCTQYVWACTDSAYPWYKDSCKKTCQNCGTGKNISYFTHINDFPIATNIVIQDNINIIKIFHSQHARTLGIMIAHNTYGRVLTHGIPGTKIPVRKRVTIAAQVIILPT